MADFVAGRGTTALGIIGTVLGGLATAGGLTGAGVNCGCNGCGYAGYNGYGYGAYVDGQNTSRYEMGLQQIISDKNAEIAYLRAQDEVDKKLVDVYSRLERRINEVSFENQRMYNRITKTVVPNDAICPGWGEVTVTPAAAPAAGA